MPKDNNRSERVEVARLKHIMHRLAFSHYRMDEQDVGDQAAFANLWYKFMQFIKPEGMYVLITMSKNWKDAEVGVVCLALVRAMVNKKGPDYTGIKVLGSMVFVSAVPCCSEAELRMAHNLAAKDADEGADQDEKEGEAEISRVEAQLASMTPKDRSHLATSDGKVIDLTEVFKRGG